MLKADWLSERIIFGVLIIAGYFIMVAMAIAMPVVVVSILPEKQADLELPTINNAISTVKDSLLVIGPLLGVIVQAIWKSDRADKQNAETLLGVTQALQTAQTQPAAKT